MTDKDVFNEITNVPKWYAGYISAQAATNLKYRFRNGNVRLDTLVNMFKRFGYKLEREWVKEETIKVKSGIAEVKIWNIEGYGNKMVKCVTHLADGEYKFSEIKVRISDLPIDDAFAPHGSYILSKNNA